jgi:hypothetical protein
LRTIIASQIGSAARQILAGANSANVMGISSRGVFLHLPSDWVLFLSFEQYRGPLTINLMTGRKELSQWQNGAEMQIYPDRLRFPSQDLELDYCDAMEWQPPDLPGRLLSPDQRRQRLEHVLLELGRMQKSSPLAETLQAMLSPGRQVKEHQKTAFSQLAALRQAWLSQDVAMIVASMLPLLGMGAGLTPAGDDLALGFLLVLNRWGGVLASGLDLKSLNREIVRGAYERTTTLSANLIECASRGQADERLILGLDALLSDVYDPGICAASLAGWGNSSGVDALVGMGLAMSCQGIPQNQG